MVDGESLPDEPELFLLPPLVTLKLLPPQVQTVRQVKEGRLKFHPGSLRENSVPSERR
jgi:hypothetical protein